MLAEFFSFEFAIGPVELLVIAAIVAICAAPFVLAGVVAWIVLSRRSKDRKD